MKSMEFGMEVSELAVRPWFVYFFFDCTITDNILELTSLCSEEPDTDIQNPHLAGHADEEVHHGVRVLLIDGLGKKGVRPRQ